MLSFSSLLIHSDDVPPMARAALTSALQGPAEQRCDSLLEAAVILHREAGLDCVDARTLVGLAECGCDGEPQPAAM